MILNEPYKNEATKLVENKPAGKLSFPVETRKRLLNSTVKLYVDAYKPQDQRKRYDPLNASGVIFNVKATTVTVLTAAHNLLLWQNLKVAPNDWTSLAADFTKSLTVFFGDKDLTFNSSLVAKCKLVTQQAVNGKVVVPNIENVCKNCQNCSYDVAVITCTDVPFSKYVKTFVLGGEETMSAEAKAVSKLSEYLLDSDDYYYVQLGYGDRKSKRTPQTVQQDKTIKEGKAVVKESAVSANLMGNNTLHYRITSPEHKEFKCVYDQIGEATKPAAYTGTPHAIVLKANGSSSTAPGDSGGPLYAIDKKTRKEIYLLGVTTGADMEASQKPPSKLFGSNISTSLIPYFKTVP